MRPDLVFEWAEAADYAARAADMDVTDLAEQLRGLCDSLGYTLAQLARLDLPEAAAEAAADVIEQAKLLRMGAVDAARRAAQRQAELEAKRSLIAARGA